MSYSKDDYYREMLSESFDENGITATSEQIAAVASDIVVCVENQGMAFYEPPASDRLNDIEREWKAKYDSLKREFEAYQGNAETAVKKALRQYSDANISIGRDGEVLRHGGRTEQIQ
ncbi:hypothetical protein HBO33_29465 [Pseudomonas gessardii]|uniref:Uncharacterized protein n=2 Tax=Pseudomonas gessardii TaxID=78544 RepID=A0A7Y1QNQ0_9PSED|nr:hypothetical protein [Pseudomonas gessardii]